MLHTRLTTRPVEHNILSCIDGSNAFISFRGETSCTQSFCLAHTDISQTKTVRFSPEDRTSFNTLVCIILKPNFLFFQTLSSNQRAPTTPLNCNIFFLCSSKFSLRGFLHLRCSRSNIPSKISLPKRYGKSSSSSMTCANPPSSPNSTLK